MITLLHFCFTYQRKKIKCTWGGRWLWKGFSHRALGKAPFLCITVPAWWLWEKHAVSTTRRALLYLDEPNKIHWGWEVEQKQQFSSAYYLPPLYIDSSGENSQLNCNCYYQKTAANQLEIISLLTASQCMELISFQIQLRAKVLLGLSLTSAKYS